MPQQMAFPLSSLLVIRLWYVRHPTNLPQGKIDWWAMNMPVIQEVLGSIPH